MLNSRIGNNIKILRKSLKLTLVELSSKLNVSKNSVHLWEKGEYKPDFKYIETMAKMIKVDPSWFFMDHSIDIVSSNTDYEIYIDDSRKPGDYLDILSDLIKIKYEGAFESQDAYIDFLETYIDFLLERLSLYRNQLSLLFANKNDRDDNCKKELPYLKRFSKIANRDPYLTAFIKTALGDTEEGREIREMFRDKK